MAGCLLTGGFAPLLFRLVYLLLSPLFCSFSIGFVLVVVGGGGGGVVVNVVIVCKTVCLYLMMRAMHL